MRTSARSARQNARAPTCQVPVADVAAVRAVAVQMWQERASCGADGAEMPKWGKRGSVDTPACRAFLQTPATASATRVWWSTSGRPRRRRATQTAASFASQSRRCAHRRRQGVRRVCPDGCEAPAPTGPSPGADVRTVPARTGQCRPVRGRPWCSARIRPSERAQSQRRCSAQRRQ